MVSLTFPYQIHQKIGNACFPFSIWIEMNRYFKHQLSGSNYLHLPCAWISILDFLIWLSCSGVSDLYKIQLQCFSSVSHLWYCFYLYHCYFGYQSVFSYQDLHLSLWLLDKVSNSKFPFGLQFLSSKPGILYDSPTTRKVFHNV